MNLRTILVVTALAVSCGKSPVPLQPGASLLPAEERELSQQIGWPEWRPEFSACWAQSGVTARVCLVDSGFSGIRAAYWAFVFAQDGRFLEANTFPSFPHHHPKAIAGINPLRLQFEKQDGSVCILTGRYLKGEGIPKIRRNLEELREYLKRSAATNIIHKTVDRPLTGHEAERS